MAKKTPAEGVKKLMETPTMKALQRAADASRQQREEAKRREDEAKRKKR